MKAPGRGTGKHAGIDLVVRRDDLTVCKVVPGEAPNPDLKRGQVQMRIEKFAFTANNVTYAAYGDTIGYWKLFPAEAGWGRVPVWGFGEVIHSANDDVIPGLRTYGFFPMSTYLTSDAKAHAGGFRDVAPHRQPLPSVYNQYLLTTADPAYDASHENEQMILRPLFLTSWLAYDFLVDEELFGARTVVVSSASSKTAYGLAFLLSRVRPKVDVIGLTSERNRDFARGLGCYDRVLTYDEIDSLARDVPVTYVDVAGSVPVRRALADRLGDSLSYAMALGDTHSQEAKPQGERLDDRFEFFFAAPRYAERAEQWGRAELARRLADAWHEFIEVASSWMTVVEESGPESVQRVFLDHVEGRADPRTGFVLSLADPTT